MSFGKVLSHEGIWGQGGQAPWILDLDTGWKCLVSMVSGITFGHSGVRETNRTETGTEHCGEEIKLYKF